MDELKREIDCEHCAHNLIRDRYATGRIQCDAIRDPQIIQIRDHVLVCVAFEEVRE